MNQYLFVFESKTLYIFFAVKENKSFEHKNLICKFVHKIFILIPQKYFTLNLVAHNLFADLCIGPMNYDTR